MAGDPQEAQRHTASLAVWDVPVAIAAGEAFSLKAGVKSSGGVEDLDLNLPDYVARVNSDLVGKFVNIASRCAGFVSKRFDGNLAAALPEPELYARFAAAAPDVASAYAERDFARAIRVTMALADEANRYIDERKPWVLAKDPANDAQLHAVCTQGINLFRALAVYLAPIVSGTARKAERFLRETFGSFDTLARPLLSHAIAPFEALMTRVVVRVDTGLPQDCITDAAVTLRHGDGAESRFDRTGAGADDAALDAKFLACATPLLGAARARELHGAMRQLAQRESVREVVRLTQVATSTHLHR